jgi:hypothetical protein
LLVEPGAAHIRNVHGVYVSHTLTFESEPPLPGEPAFGADSSTSLTFILLAVKTPFPSSPSLTGRASYGRKPLRLLLPGGGLLTAAIRGKKTTYKVAVRDGGSGSSCLEGVHGLLFSCWISFVTLVPPLMSKRKQRRIAECAVM